MPADRNEQHVVNAAITLLRHLVRTFVQMKPHQALQAICAEISERAKGFVSPEFWKTHGERLKAEIKRMVKEKLKDDPTTRVRGDPPG